MSMSPLVVLVVCCVAVGQAEEAYLAAVTPPSPKVRSDAFAMAVDEAGTVAVAYRVEGAGRKISLRASVGRGNSFRAQQIPLPQGWKYRDASPLRLAAMAGRSGRFWLLLGSYSKLYVSHYSGGRWSIPELLQPSWGADEVCGICIGDDGVPRIFHSAGQHNNVFFYYSEGKWRGVQLKQLYLSKHAGQCIVCSPSHVHAVMAKYARGATGREVPMLLPVVLSIPLSAQPNGLSSFHVLPPSDWQGMSSPLPPGYRTSPTRLAVDPATGRLWAAWTDNKQRRLHVACAPIGATSKNQWREWTLPEHIYSPSGFWLAGNGRGAVAVAYLGQVEREGRRYERLYMRWLSPSGPSQALLLRRRSSVTEAEEFSEIYSGTVRVYIAPDGTALAGMVAVKQGEVPAGTKRIFLAIVSAPGGAVRPPSPPSISPRPTGKPDFKVEIVSLRGLVSRAAPTNRFRLTYTISPTVRITNLGAEYYGDLWLELAVDGAVVRVHYPAPAGAGGEHGPLLRRGESKIFHVPSFKYMPGPRQGWQPPRLSLERSQTARTSVLLYAPLGRKRMIARVDPDNKVAEEREDNNTAAAEYILYDGLRDVGRLQGRTVYGFNDVSIVGRPVLLANTPLIRAGYVPRPTKLRVAVGNLRGARYFADVPILVRIDGRPFARTMSPLLDGQPDVRVADLVGFGVDPYSIEGLEPSDRVDVAVAEIPIDLSKLPIGRHRLEVIIDPQDSLGDIIRENNSSRITFPLRQVGGTVNVRVVESATRQPIRKAFVCLAGLWWGYTAGDGRVTVPDVPPGTYERGSLWVRAFGYWRGKAPSFSVANGQTINLQVALEKPVELWGRITNARTGELITDEVVHVAVEDVDLPDSGGRKGEYRFSEVPPGTHRLRAWAYCYQPRTVTAAVHADVQGRCRVDISLHPAPTATLTGTVTDLSGRKVHGAVVWLAGTSRRAVTDSKGHFEISRVQAGRTHVLWAYKTGYLTTCVQVPAIAPSGIGSVSVQMRRVTTKVKSIGFHGVGWAIFEHWPGVNLGFASTPEYSVKVAIGHFHMTMACSYYTIQGQAGTYLGTITIASRGGPFWKSYVGSSWSPAEVICGVIEDVAGETVVGKAAEAYGYLLELVSPIQDAINMAKNDVNPHELHDGTVIGTYTTHTGAKLDEVSFVDYLPGASAELSGSCVGGATVVMAKELVISDGTKTRRFGQLWCSPRIAVYRVNEQFDMSNLEIKLYVWLLDSELSSGMLGDNSKNVIDWRPWKKRLTMHRWR